MKYVDKYTSAANFGIFQKFFDNKVPHPTGITGTTMVSVPYTKEQMYNVGATINSDGFYELDIRQMGDIIYGKGKSGAIFGTMSIFTIYFLFIFLILFVLVFLTSKLVEKFFKKDCIKNKTQKIFSKKFKKIILIVSIMLLPFLIFFTHKFVYKKPPF